MGGTVISTRTDTPVKIVMFQDTMPNLALIPVLPYCQIMPFRFNGASKSILCQEDEYLLELVRYIHLNPVRAGVVKSLGELDRYRWSGHSVLVGCRRRTWPDRGEILSHFGLSLSNTFINNFLTLRDTKESQSLRKLSDSNWLSKGARTTDKSDWITLNAHNIFSQTTIRCLIDWIFTHPQQLFPGSYANPIFPGDQLAYQCELRDVID